MNETYRNASLGNFSGINPTYNKEDKLINVYNFNRNLKEQSVSEEKPIMSEEKKMVGEKDSENCSKGNVSTDVEIEEEKKSHSFQSSNQSNGAKPLDQVCRKRGESKLIMAEDYQSKQKPLSMLGMGTAPTETNTMNSGISSSLKAYGVPPTGVKINGWTQMPTGINKTQPMTMPSGMNGTQSMTYSNGMNGKQSMTMPGGLNKMQPMTMPGGLNRTQPMTMPSGMNSTQPITYMSGMNGKQFTSQQNGGTIMKSKEMPTAEITEQTMQMPGSRNQMGNYNNMPSAPEDMNQRYYQYNNQSESCRGTIHVIQAGDSLYNLGKLYGVSVDALIRANPYVNVYNLQVGDELCIPGIIQS